MILDRLVVEIANDADLAEALVLKGGTCLHKLWLPEPWRYSKDLDFERTGDAPMGPVFDGLRAAGQRAGFTAKARTSPGELLSHVVYRGAFADGEPMRISVDVPTSPPRDHRPFSQTQPDGAGRRLHQRSRRAGRDTRRNHRVQSDRDLRSLAATRRLRCMGRSQGTTRHRCGRRRVLRALPSTELDTPEGAGELREQDRRSLVSRHAVRVRRQAPQRFDIDECSEAVESLIEECAKRLVVP